MKAQPQRINVSSVEGAAATPFPDGTVDWDVLANSILRPLAQAVHGFDDAGYVVDPMALVGRVLDGHRWPRDPDEPRADDTYSAESGGWTSTREDADRAGVDWRHVHNRVAYLIAEALADTKGLPTYSGDPVAQAKDLIAQRDALQAMLHHTVTSRLETILSRVSPGRGVMSYGCLEGPNVVHQRRRVPADRPQDVEAIAGMGDLDLMHFRSLMVDALSHVEDALDARGLGDRITRRGRGLATGGVVKPSADEGVFGSIRRAAGFPPHPSATG